MGILPRAPTAALVRKKTDAVEIRKGPLRNRFVLEFAINACMLVQKPAHACAVAVVRSAVSQFFFESLFHPLHVAVLAEDQRQHQPVIARAHLTVGAAITLEATTGPSRSIRHCELNWLPLR